MNRTSRTSTGLRSFISLFTLAAGLVILPSAQADARLFRPNQVPNGEVFGCATCHMSPNGGDARNLFGQDVENTLVGDALVGELSVNWSAIFNLDSDGDGQSNGLELGDPCGVWTGEGLPFRDFSISDPSDPQSQTPDQGELVANCDPIPDAGSGAFDAGPGAFDAGPGAFDAGPGAFDAGPGDAGQAPPLPPRDAGETQEPDAGETQETDAGEVRDAAISNTDDAGVDPVDDDAGVDPENDAGLSIDGDDEEDDCSCTKSKSSATPWMGLFAFAGLFFFRKKRR